MKFGRTFETELDTFSNSRSRNIFTERDSLGDHHLITQSGDEICRFRVFWGTPPPPGHIRMDFWIFISPRKCCQKCENGFLALVAGRICEKYNICENFLSPRKCCQKCENGFLALVAGRICEKCNICEIFLSQKMLPKV